MKSFTVKLTDAELKALEYVASSAQEWIDNAVHERCRLAMEEIFEVETKRMLADPNVTQIPANIEEVVLSAELKSAKQRHDELVAEAIASS